jgi:hypothetical protein
VQLDGQQLKNEEKSPYASLAEVAEKVMNSNKGVSNQLFPQYSLFREYAVVQLISVFLILFDSNPDRQHRFQSQSRSFE